MNGVPAEIGAILKKSRRVLVAAHIRPDGDAVGSCAAMGWICRTLRAPNETHDTNDTHDAGGADPADTRTGEREVLLYNASGFPETLSWLSLPAPLIRRAERLPGPPDLIVALDSGDLKRLGDDLRPLFDTTPSIVIDHHRGNPGFASLYNWVDPACSSVGEMVALLAKSLGLPLCGPLAEALYLAIVTDTGAFAYGNTAPGTLRLCAEMMENGLNAAELRDRIDKNWSEPRLRLWGECMARATVLEQGRLAVAAVTRDMLSRHGASAEDCEGLVEQLRRLRGVRVALLMTEPESAGAAGAARAACAVHTKISLRSSGNDDVQAVAAQFGGGGHKNAAGAMLPLPQDKTLAALMPYIVHIWSKGEYAKSSSCVNGVFRQHQGHAGA